MDKINLVLSILCALLSAGVLIFVIATGAKDKKKTQDSSGYDEVIDALGEAVGMVKENQENTAKNSREHIVSNINTANSRRIWTTLQGRLTILTSILEIL